MSKDFLCFLRDAAPSELTVRTRFKEHELCTLGQLMALGLILLEQLNF